MKRPQGLPLGTFSSLSTISQRRISSVPMFLNTTYMLKAIRFAFLLQNCLWGWTLECNDFRSELEVPQDSALGTFSTFSCMRIISSIPTVIDTIYILTKHKSQFFSLCRRTSLYILARKTLTRREKERDFTNNKYLKIYMSKYHDYTPHKTSFSAVFSKSVNGIIIHPISQLRNRIVFLSSVISLTRNI